MLKTNNKDASMKSFITRCISVTYMKLINENVFSFIVYHIPFLDKKANVQLI